MTFALVAIASIAWSLTVLRWSISRRHSLWRKRVVAVSVAAGVAAAVSIAADLRSIWLRWRAPHSDVAIVIKDMGQWWQLSYRRGTKTFITANEIHVPADARVAMTWSGGRAMVWRSRDFLPVEAHDFFFLADNVGIEDVAVIRAWPPSRRRLRIVADPPSVFEDWFANEMAPAKPTAGGQLIVDAGCGYCHVIRGVSASPQKSAPELTHFAGRTTIGAMDLPNQRGFLSGWIVNSQALKRGSEMPANALDPTALHQVVTYLESLQ